MDSALAGASPGRLRASRRRALPDPARSAGQHVQVAVDVDDLD
jgi:hypothetical protein